MKILGRTLIIIPFIKLLVDFVPTLEDFNIYYTGLWGLVLLGLVGLLFDINRILSTIYVLVGYGFYSYYFGYDIYNLWPVGGLLINLTEDRKEVCATVNIKTEDKNLLKRSEEVVVVKVSEPKKKVVSPSPAPAPARMSREELFWQKYDQRNKKGIFIKLKEKINEYCGSY